VKAWAHELVNFVAQYRSRKEVIRSSYERRVDLARIVRLLAVPVLLLAFASSCSIGNIKSDERDGEATVYDLGDFSGDFDLAYAVSFEPAPANQSWTVVTILLLSRTQSSSAVSVGLARGYPDATTLSGFTTSNRSRETSKYQSYPVRCNVCMVELRGDKATLTALLDGHKVGTWPRRVFSAVKPYVQLNGEVHEMGDTISARLVPVRTLLGRKVFPRPACALSTQGVEARAIGEQGAIEFSGARRDGARATYYSLSSGKTGHDCFSKPVGAGQWH